MNKLSYIVRPYQSRSHPPLSWTVIATPYDQEQKQELPLDLFISMMSDSSSEAFEHKMESLETSLHEDVSEEDKDDMLITGRSVIIWSSCDTKTVIRSRVEV